VIPSNKKKVKKTYLGSRKMQNMDHIFREYDIRGLVDTELTAEMTERIGFAFGSLCPIEHLKIIVGKDNRPSSRSLAEGLMRGLIASGAQVIDIGTVPTPVVYWAERTSDAHGGIQITGSHNPAEWNGVKMSLNGKPFYGENIQNLRNFDAEYGAGDQKGGGSLLRKNVILDYIKDVTGRFQLRKPLKVVLDCGNGAGSLVGVEVLEGIGAKVVPLYCESDGTFPNHHPDPTVDENLSDLIMAVQKEGADLGIGFDGDADRIGAVDDRGNIVRGDLLLLLLGLDILRKNGNAKMIFDVKCSQVIPEEFTKAGGEAIMWKTGHSLIKNKMTEEGADLAGELSGHIFFADDYFGFDDAPYCAARLVEMLSRSEMSLFEMLKGFNVYQSTPEIRIDIPENRKKEIIDAAAQHFGKLYEVLDVDGVRILFEGGWGLLRASNTQPILVARFEAEKLDQLQEIRSEIEEWLETKGVLVQ
tara:strand:- start:160 stop:1578 length:1419 start_codon:yes stop_codon:yes gene_type:complete